MADYKTDATDALKESLKGFYDEVLERGGGDEAVITLADLRKHDELLLDAIEKINRDVAWMWDTKEGGWGRNVRRMS